VNIAFRNSEHILNKKSQFTDHKIYLTDIYP